MDISAAKARLEEYLKENHLRPTRERFLVLEEIMGTNDHFEADRLYATLRRKGLKASRATVYNTLDLLVACGLISRTRFGTSHSRYEKAFGRPRHDHLICLECGDIIEFVSGDLERLQAEICRKNTFELRNSTLQIFGVCARCQSREKAMRGERI